MTLDLYYNLSTNSKIGLPIPAVTIKEKEGICLSLKLKPPKIPKKSKKIYKDLFIRSLKHSSEHHIYAAINGLYVVSVYKCLDEAFEWIDKNYETIMKRIKEYE